MSSLFIVFISCDNDDDVNNNDCDLAEACLLVPNPGPCLAYIPKYFFNQTTKQCEEFIWGGCGGVVPFETLEECEICLCNQNEPDDPCTLIPDSGPCEAAIPKYFFNQETGQCEEFIWGGCEGVVPFETLEACENSQCSANPCQLIPDVGPCDAAFPKYFFNQETGQCEMFVWGGCGGVVPFDTIEECQICL